MNIPSEDAIRARAYELWEQDGRPDGKDVDYWLRAARELEDGDMEGDGVNAVVENPVLNQLRTASLEDIDANTGSKPSIVVGESVPSRSQKANGTKATVAGL
jgi:hypothetical protein